MFQVEDSSEGNRKLTARSKAKVTDNIDPLKKGRIRVLHPTLGTTVWIPYLSSPGMFSVPEIGDVVYLECESGIQNYPVAWGNLNAQADDSPTFPDVFQRNTPTNRGMFTPGGHLFELDDGLLPLSKGKGIRFTSSTGHKLHILEDLTSNTDQILLETSNGTQVNIDNIKDLIELNTAAGATVTVDGLMDKIDIAANFGDELSVSAANGIQASTPSGTSLSMKNGVIQLDGTGGKLKLGTAQVGLGSAAAELVDLFEQTLTQLDALLTSMQSETHLGNLGYPSGPPLNAAAYAAVQALLVVIKAFVTSIKGGV